MNINRQQLTNILVKELGGYSGQDVQLSIDFTAVSYSGYNDYLMGLDITIVKNKNIGGSRCLEK